MNLPRMVHIATKAPDGSIHVQNILGPYLGQHHVHSKRGFQVWKHTTNATVEFERGTRKCTCGLRVGQVKNHEGVVTVNDRFEPKPAKRPRPGRRARGDHA